MDDGEEMPVASLNRRTVFVKIQPEKRVAFKIPRPILARLLGSKIHRDRITADADDILHEPGDFSRVCAGLPDAHDAGARG